MEARLDGNERDFVLVLSALQPPLTRRPWSRRSFMRYPVVLKDLGYISTRFMPRNISE